MIAIPDELLRKLAAAAEAAYPRECCGLLIGRPLDRIGTSTSAILVTRVEESPNVTDGDATKGFEVDPKLRLDLMRELGAGPDRIVGLFHSHPDHTAQPSQRDLEMAWEPELVWVIVSVVGGRAVDTTAHRIAGSARRFEAIAIRTAGRRPASSGSRPAA